MKKTPRDKTPTASPELSRRKALARLGFGAAAVYSAPVILHLDRSANAGIVPTPCPPRGAPARGKGPPFCRRRPRGHKNTIGKGHTIGKGGGHDYD